MTRRDIVVHANPDVLAAAAAARLVTRLVDVQAAGRVPRLVLTGGGIGIAVLEQLAPRPGPRRRRLAARRVLLGRRAVPAARRPGAQRDAGPRGAARPPAGRPGSGCTRWAPTPAPARRAPRPRRRPTRTLLAGQARPEDHGPVPTFDITLLGMGGEGHTASVFPHSPAVYETERTVVAVHGCPKPPPTRVSLTLPAIRRSTEVWILATGDAKAAAVALALSGAGEVAIPVAGATGTRRTLLAARPRRGGQAAPRPRARRSPEGRRAAPRRRRRERRRLPPGRLVARPRRRRPPAGGQASSRCSCRGPKTSWSCSTARRRRSAETAGSDPRGGGGAGASRARGRGRTPSRTCRPIPLLDVVHAPADGDSAIVALVEELAGESGPGAGGDGRPRAARPGAGGRRRRHRPGDVPRGPAGPA